MDRVKLYIQESYNELVNKVSWPTWKELQASSLVVLVGTLIISLIVWIMDTVAKYSIVEFLYKKVFG
ncbi:MAG: preprotein translocase subunit SecE [Bacteroidota bacterium]